ncbi:MAG: hypothetical protein EOM74_01935 [Methanomicrobia archaeon]|nr:hypothetical protein [Methanomicrobia archaeon]
MSGKKFITADLWFGRPEIIDLRKRKFDNVTDMNNHIIAAWNKYVQQGDTVYVLGNFASDVDAAEYALDYLNGTIIFVNPDSVIANMAYRGGTRFGITDSPALKNLPKGICDLYVIDANPDPDGDHIFIYDANPILTFDECDEDCIISYWPLRDWPGKESGTFHIFGMHEKNDARNYKEGAISASWDNWGFPIPLNELHLAVKLRDAKTVKKQLQEKENNQVSKNDEAKEEVEQS